MGEPVELGGYAGLPLALLTLCFYYQLFAYPSDVSFNFKILSDAGRKKSSLSICIYTAPQHLIFMVSFAFAR